MKRDRKQHLVEAAANYLKQVGRKRRKNGLDPNDRTHDRKLEEQLKRMPPEDVDALFHDDAD